MTSIVPDDLEATTLDRAQVAEPRAEGGSGRGVITGLVIDLGVAVVVGWLLVGLGVVSVIVGFARVSNSDSLAEQFAYFSSGCIGGIILIGIGACMVLTRQYADLRTAAEQTQELIRLRQTAAARGEGEPGGVGPAHAGEVIAAPGSSTFHAPGCVFVEGRPGMRRIPARSPELEDMQSCQLCISQ